MAAIRADGIAVYVYYRQADDIFFLQIHRTEKTGEYQWSWQIVYGGIEPGETATQAALREMREEIGLAPHAMHQVEYVEQFYFRPHDYILMMPVFAAEVLPTDPIMLNEEHDAFRWVHARDVGTHFMWRTQREALQILLEELRTQSLAAGFMKIKLA